MARRATGGDVLQKARADVASAVTATQLRAALAVTLPLVLGLSLAETGAAIGKTSAWVGRTRMRYIKGPRKEKPPEGRGGRRNCLLTLAEEKHFVEKAASIAQWHGGEIRQLCSVVGKHLGYEISRSAAYKMFHRNNGLEVLAEKRKKFAQEVDRQHAATTAS